MGTYQVSCGAANDASIFYISTGFNLSDSNQAISMGGGRAILSCSLVAGTLRRNPEMCSARDWLVCDKSLNIW